MQFLTLYWWEWLAYLLVFSCFTISGLWLLMTLPKKKPLTGATRLMPSLPAESAAAVPEVQRQGKRTVWIATMTLIAGLGIGYKGRDLQMRINVKSLPETLILDVNSDGSYRMLASDGRRFDTTFCHGKDDLLQGNKLKEFKFEQRVGCKNIHGDGLGYVAYTDHGVRRTYPIPTEVANVR
jgi:hypothetical protein